MFKIYDIRVEEAPEHGPDTVRVSWKCKGDGFARYTHRQALDRGIHKYADDWMNQYGMDYEC